MAEVEDVRIEKTEMEEMRIDNRVQLTRVFVGGGGDFIVVSGNDISIIDRFQDAGDKMMKIADDMEKAVEEIKKKYGDEENPDLESSDRQKIIEIQKDFSVKATEIMDGVFGKGTTRKFFGDVYAVIPDFLPSEECFLDFFDSLIPVIERLSKHRVKLEKLASKKRMDKYQPHDFKKKGSK